MNKVSKQVAALSKLASPGKTPKVEGIIIREIRREDVQEASDLIVRLKKLNSEFDPLLKTIDKIELEALETIKDSMSDKNGVILVAAVRSKLVGLIKAVLKDRVFYEPRKEGLIIEFYILPEFRRGNLGQLLLSSVVRNLKKKGANLIVAEFPSQNEIAKKFYTKLGFRSLTNMYAKRS